MPAEPEAVGAYLAVLAPRYRLATLRRRLAALARAHRAAGHRLDTGHPAIRETLCEIGRRHGVPQRRAAALATAEVRRLVAACHGDLAGLRDRALLLLGYAAALRRSELGAVEAWLRGSAIRYGPVFCRVTRWGVVKQGQGLSGEGVRLVLRRRAEEAGVEGTWLEPVSPHGLCAGSVTQATRGPARRGHHGPHPAPRCQDHAPLRPPRPPAGRQPRP